MTSCAWRERTYLTNEQNNITDDLMRWSNAGLSVLVVLNSHKGTFNIVLSDIGTVIEELKGLIPFGFKRVKDLHVRRIEQDMIMCYEIINGLVAMNCSDFFSFNNVRTRGHNFKLPECRLDARKVSFARKVCLFCFFGACVSVLPWDLRVLLDVLLSSNKSFVHSYYFIGGQSSY